MSKNSILDLYSTYAAESTDAPTKYHRYCAAAMVSAILGRRAWFQLGHATIFPSLWVCVLGQSSLAKKSTSTGIAIDIIARVNPDLVLPTKFTTEGLYRLCSDPERPEGLRGIGVMQFAELQTLITSFGRDYNAELKSTLTDWYDCPPVRSYTTAGAGTISVKRPAITFLAASTPDWLIEAAQSKDIRGGFYPRWLFSIATSPDKEAMAMPPPRDEAKANEIVSKLKQLLDFFKYEYSPGSPHGQCRMTEAGEKEYRSIYGEMRERYYGDHLLGAFAGRAQVQTIKLAMIHALANHGNPMLGPDSIRWGYDMVSESITDVACICQQMGDSKTEINTNKLRNFIRSAGPGGVTKTAILRGSGFTDSAYVDKLLKNLMEAGWILKVSPPRQPGQRGRTADVYVAVDFEVPGAGKVAANGN